MQTDDDDDGEDDASVAVPLWCTTRSVKRRRGIYIFFSISCLTVMVDIWAAITRLDGKLSTATH